MADYPEGFELDKAQALLIACSTQVLTCLPKLISAAAPQWPGLSAQITAPDVRNVTDSFLSAVIQGDGVPPIEAQDFCSWLNSKAAPDLHGVNFSVCALGDK